MRYLAQIDTRVRGIPCRIGVLGYESYAAAYVSGPPERCSPAFGGFGDYEILDQRGRLAPWLAKKISKDDEALIQETIFEYMEG